MNVIVSDGQGKTYDNRRKLKSFGMKWMADEKDMSAYRVDTEDGALAKRIGAYAARRKLRCRVIEKQWTRNAAYRKTFFETHEPDEKGRYRCSYCGKKIEEIEIDHIVPVKAVEDPMTRDKWIRKLAKRGINGINDAGNLAPACARCNRKKSAKTGWWVVKGHIGQSDTYWKCVKALRTTLVVLFVFIVAYCCL